MGAPSSPTARKILRAAGLVSWLVCSQQAEFQSRILLPEVERGNLMDTENNLHDTIYCCRPDCYPLATEHFAQRQCLALVADRSIDADFPHRVSCSILPFARDFGKGPLAGLVAVRRNFQTQCFMRSLVVVNLPPGIKTPLAGRTARSSVALLHYARFHGSKFFHILNPSITGTWVNTCHFIRHKEWISPYYI